MIHDILNIYIYIYIYRQVSSVESYMSRVLNTVVELIRLEDKLELLHMNFISHEKRKKEKKVPMK
jgi:hypothetical protein